jgi:hypothetical protein
MHLMAGGALRPTWKEIPFGLAMFYRDAKQSWPGVSDNA